MGPHCVFILHTFVETCVFHNTNISHSTVIPKFEHKQAPHPYLIVPVHFTYVLKIHWSIILSTNSFLCLNHRFRLLWSFNHIWSYFSGECLGFVQFWSFYSQDDWLHCMWYHTFFVERLMNRISPRIILGFLASFCLLRTKEDLWRGCFIRSDDIFNKICVAFVWLK